MPELEEGALAEDPHSVPVELQRVRGRDYTTIYSNFAQVGQTPWDIRFLFSQLGETGVNEGGVTDLVTVIMTPALAKALINVLSANIKAYERENGEIKIPEAILREAEKRKIDAKAKAEAKERAAKLKPEF